MKCGYLSARYADHTSLGRHRAPPLQDFDLCPWLTLFDPDVVGSLRMNDNSYLPQQQELQFQGHAQWGHTWRMRVQRENCDWLLQRAHSSSGCMTCIITGRGRQLSCVWTPSDRWLFFFLQFVVNAFNFKVLSLISTCHWGESIVDISMRKMITSPSQSFENKNWMGTWRHILTSRIASCSIEWRHCLNGVSSTSCKLMPSCCWRTSLVLGKPAHLVSKCWNGWSGFSPLCSYMSALCTVRSIQALCFSYSTVV